MLTNVPIPAKGYSFPVRFSDDHYYKSKAPRNNVQVLYDCRVDLPFVGIVDMQSHRRISLEIHIASSFLPLRSIKYILFLSQKT
ncbi:unnamed protein product [Camellia sinensis]